MSKKRQLPFIALCFLVFASISCLPKIPQSMQSWQTQPSVASNLFTTNDCVHSCWMGLRPGNTTEQEVEVFMNTNLSIISNVETGKADYGYSSYLGNYIDEIHHITVITRRGYLFSINLSGRFDIDLDTIVSQLGDPEYILLFYGTEIDGSLYGVLITYYPQAGYSFRFFLSNITRTSSNEVKVCFSVEEKAASIDILESGSIRQHLSGVEVPLSPGEGQLLDYLKPWPGFSCMDLPLTENETLIIY